MNHDLVVALQTAAALGGSAFLAWLVAGMLRVWKSPKRLSRLEAAQPWTMEALVAIIDITLVGLKCQQGHTCNGDLEEAEKSAREIRKQMVRFLGKQSVSQPDKK